MNTKLPGVGFNVEPTSKTKLESLNLDNSARSDDSKRPKAFKFGQVDQNMLMSRLYSTPFKKPNSQQKFMLDMSMTSIHKPHIKKLDNPPPQPEPLVKFLKKIPFLFFLFLIFKY